MRCVSALKLVASSKTRIKASADTRQLLARQPVDNAFAADSRDHAHESRRVGSDFADQCGVAAKRMRPEDLQQTVGIGRWRDSDKLAFVGDVQSVEAEQLAGSENLRSD